MVGMTVVKELLLRLHLGHSVAQSSYVTFKTTHSLNQSKVVSKNGAGTVNPLLVERTYNHSEQRRVGSSGKGP